MGLTKSSDCVIPSYGGVTDSSLLKALAKWMGGQMILGIRCTFLFEMARQSAIGCRSSCVEGGCVQSISRDGG